MSRTSQADGHRLTYRFRRRRLDHELAFGFDPNHDPDRRRRANELTSERSRKDLARRLGGLVSEAAGSPHWQRPERWAAIRKASPELTLLAETLAGSTEVSAQGVARAGLLLDDGNSPFYGPDRDDELRTAVGAALAGLELGPMLEPRRDLVQPRNSAPAAYLRAAQIRGHGQWL
jgi:hypothetical protein